MTVAKFRVDAATDAADAAASDADQFNEFNGREKTVKTKDGENVDVVQMVPLGLKSVAGGRKTGSKKNKRTPPN